MHHLVELSGECPELARAEALSVCRAPPESARHDGRALIIQSDIDPNAVANRLGLAWSVSRHLFSCGAGELDSCLAKADLPGETFRVRVGRLDTRHTPEDGIAMARHAGRMLSSRFRVDLKHPDVDLRILMAKDIHAGILLGTVDRRALEARKAENRPFKHPISLHPKLARALVNLTGIREDQTLLDPFCGTGGILLEAGLMGCRIVGGDIDNRMVEGTLQNLGHFGIRHTDIRQADISDWPKAECHIDAIAADPPYGRSASTAKETVGSLYKRAFIACRDMLSDGGRLAIVLPAEKHTQLAEGFAMEGMYPVRVHRSLTRFFCVFRAA
jgi:tRNA (guanine10-N2)-dimethyltransferase